MAAILIFLSVFWKTESKSGKSDTIIYCGKAAVSSLFFRRYNGT